MSTNGFSVDLNVTAYRAAEHSNAGHIDRVNGQLSGAGGDPGIY